jgi:hypothetical protein
MCWVGNRAEARKKKALSNINVIKIGRLRVDDEGNVFFISSIKDFIYKENVLAKKIGLKVDKSNIFRNMINEGYHSYLEKTVKKEDNAYYTLDVGGVEFLYSYVWLGKFVIPKGCYYYENKNGEIVSERIKFIGPYNINYTKSKMFKLMK